jgi:hypothetical protein
VETYWNFLYGFPGEDAEDYTAVASLMPALYHLPPPTAFSRIRLDRFSPYWARPDEYPIENIRPYWSCSLIYKPLPPELQSRLAYFFEFDYLGGADPATYAEPCLCSLRDWQESESKAIVLELRIEDGQAIVVDTRPESVAVRSAVCGPGIALLKALDSISNADRATAEVLAEFPGLESSEVESLLATFLQRRWVVKEGAGLLSIVLDPLERHRIADLTASLKLGKLGFDYDKDFQDPEAREVIRNLMLGNEATGI